MSSTIAQSISTYTSERVTRILQDDLHVRIPGARAIPVEFGVLNLRLETSDDNVLNYHSIEDRALRATTYCEKYLVKIRESIEAENIITTLDEEHSHLLQCSFRPQIPKDVVVQRVCQLLSRLPATPVELGNRWDAHCSTLSDDHFLLGTPSSPRSWGHLKATNFVATNTIRLAIQIECAGEYYWAGIFKSYINLVAELLDATLNISAAAERPPTAEELVLQAFLWTSWQRGVMLHLSYLLGGHLRIGYDFSRNRALSLEIPRTLHKMFQGGSSSFHKLPSYLCLWAFESIRSDRAAVMLDFRGFAERYGDIFGTRAPRCVSARDGDLQCSGDSPGACNRFIGKKIEDQSAHATSCSGSCSRLFWNEESYKGCSGARAVTIEGSDEILQYCTASRNTMAVSHVWSHGQGGRPENPPPLKRDIKHRLPGNRNKALYGTGLNKCLHERYKQISTRFGCDSYWMDTPCIPQDHQLRSEAIQNINAVFANSKFTLICDMDLMQFDVTNLTTALRESILAALLVCDWNVRAWTLLEAMRGRHNTQILCRNEQVISLRETLEDVHRHGSLALAGLFATAQHLLPAQPPPPGSKSSPYLVNRAKGYVSLEEAACLLSHRHASRPGDEVIIWSLLCGETVQETAIDLWRHKPNQSVLTAFLVSSCPRIQSPWKKAHRGFGWAPRRPNMPALRQLPLRETYFADDGARSDLGLFTTQGLKAAWLVAHMKGALSSLLTLLAGSSTLVETDSLLRQIAFRFLKKYAWGALLQATENLPTDQPVWYRGNADGVLLVVVGSQDRRKWHWRGVYEWDSLIPLPVFTREEIFLV